MEVVCLLLLKGRRETSVRKAFGYSGLRSWPFENLSLFLCGLERGADELCGRSFLRGEDSRDCRSKRVKFGERLNFVGEWSGVEVEVVLRFRIEIRIVMMLMPGQAGAERCCARTRGASRSRVIVLTPGGASPAPTTAVGRGKVYFGVVVAEARVSAAWFFTRTESQIWAMWPVLSMRKVVRTIPLKVRPMNFFMRHWP